jgi:putative ABC transport system substrate-binding protein
MPTFKKYRVLLMLSVILLSSVLPAHASEIIVIGDTRLKPVTEIIAGIKETLDSPLKVFQPSAVKGKLKDIALRENARVVVALGKESLDESIQLPPSVAVIYALVIVPPEVHRPNTTGFYMATPVKEYVDLFRTHLHSIKRIAVVGSHDLIRILNGAEHSQVSSYNVKSPFELVRTLSRIDSEDAILLLPDVSLLTASTVEEAYLLSFKKGIPLIGISERDVRRGALLALVFEPENVGRLIGESALSAIKGADVGRMPPSPPHKFELYINTDTAAKMGIQISPELARKATKVYP